MSQMVIILGLPLPKSRSILFENLFDQTGDETITPLSAISAYRNDLISVLAQPEPLPILTAIDTYLPFLLAMKDSVQQLMSGKSASINFYWTSPTAVNFRSSFYSCNNVNLEILMVYNALAYCHRNVARRIMRDTAPNNDSAFDMNTRKSSNHLCIAAGVFEYLYSTQTAYLWNIDHSEGLPEKMPELYLAFSNICLAEAQQIAIQKAVISGTTSPGLLAKLCMDNYKKFTYAETLLRTMKKNTPGIRSLEHFHVQESIWSFLALNSLISYSLALKFLAIKSYNEMKHGVAVGYLQLALKKLNIETAYGSSTTIVELVKNYNALKTELVQLLKSYRSENNAIYFALVPEEAALEIPAENKCVVKSIPYTPPQSQLSPIVLVPKPGKDCLIM